MEKLYILVITHEYGINSSVYSTYDKALEDCARFCKEYWQDRFGAEDVPYATDEKIVSLYFDENNFTETYNIEEVTLDERCYAKVG